MKHSITWSQALSFRLHRHCLAGQNRPTDPVTVCQNMYGMQAQVMSAAELQFWTRVPSLHSTQIHTALWDDRTLVKSSLMRQTLHIIAAADFATCISALKTSRMAVLERIMARYGNITQEETDEINAAIVEALASGPMTQPKLKEKVLAITGKKIRKYMEYAWSIQLFRPALVQGLICYGPDQGKKSTFVRVDQWLPKQKRVAERKAKQILLR
ncbi:winged helix DNA-binding domain-containing protein, partial [bacterium]|nr:winged helix DNA-binding domain-containing protein [bacterium]